MNKRNVKWHRLSADAAVKQLHTNASCGLSRKEARSRFRADGANTLFDPSRATSTLIKRILTDPILLLTAAVCLLAVCFFEPALGITTLVPILIALTISLRSAVLIKKRKDLKNHHKNSKKRKQKFHLINTRNTLKIQSK